MLSPEDALSDCIRAIPAFGPYWAGEDCFRSEDGSFTECGVYLTLTWFLREHWRSVSESEWRALASLAAEHNRRAEAPPATVGACLIEGLEGEAYSPLVAQYFDERLLSAYGFRA
jgi:hypothetical protein